MNAAELFLVGLVMAVGVAGTVIPLVPGLVLVWGAGLVWALNEDGVVRWAVLAVLTVLLVVGVTAKYVLSTRSVSRQGAPRSTLVVGAVGAIVGFFVIPVLGVLVGLVVGVLLAEQYRLRDWRLAWRSTRAALVALGIGVLVELSAGVAMVVTWLAGVAATQA